MTILVVDDIKDTADSVAELIAAETGLSVHSESDPEAALLYAENNLLTVAVLDEEMPKMKGTELWAQMRRITPLTAALMLTQERGAVAVQRALKLGYREHLWKSELDQLPATVLELHIQVCSERAKRDSQDTRVLLWRRRSLFRCRPQVWLLSRKVIEERFISPDWHDYLTVNSGQTVKASRQLRNSESLLVESESSSTVGTQLNLANTLAGIAPKLEASLATRDLIRTNQERESVETLEMSYALAAERPDAGGPQVRARSYEYAHVFTRSRLVLAVICPDCGAESRVVLVVRVPQEIVCTRQIDFYDDSSRVVVETGFRRIAK